MELIIDWDTYELLQWGNYTDEELDAAIEDVREEMDYHYPNRSVKLEDLLDELTSMRDRSK